jgi:hypothetical protein
METLAGAALPNVAHVTIIEGERTDPAPGTRWGLRGVTRPVQYITAGEEEHLASLAPPLGRPEATRAALLPVRKSRSWWELPHAERRRIFQAASRHAEIGLRYLPAVARRLYHCRELGEQFDFITWFEFSAENSRTFATLLSELRDTDEWSYVDREIDIRLVRGE